MNLTYKGKIRYQIKKPLQVKEKKEKKGKETNTLLNIKKKRVTKYKKYYAMQKQECISLMLTSSES